MIRLANKELCSGCTACASKCPHRAISMRRDRLGFAYPEIDMAACTDCGICEAVCPFQGHAHRNSVIEVYAVRHKDMKQLAASQSGAAFVALSDVILSRGGVVYGAGYGEGFKVVHGRAVSPSERDAFRGSKYVQSELGTVFAQVKADLLDGKHVLFSGTPCQVAGLKSYLHSGGKLYENLYLVDLVCHGVASPYVWRDYLWYLERAYKHDIVAVNFRDKIFGWHSHKESFKFDDGSIIYPRFIVYKDCFLRPACGNCPYANLNHPSDVTIGDFWGIEQTDLRAEDDNKGHSILLCNTPQGVKLFDSIKEQVHFHPLAMSTCLQPNLCEPTRIPRSHLLFEKFYRRSWFVAFLKVRNFPSCLKRFVKRVKQRLL